MNRFLPLGCDVGHLLISNKFFRVAFLVFGLDVSWPVPSRRSPDAINFIVNTLSFL